MGSKKPVIVYGASGYTGRLVCEYLRELGIPFIAAGRDEKRTREVVERIPGIETADYEVVGVKHDVKSLTELFRGAKVVCNMVGPFIKYGPETVEACLQAGCHYLDTTGEQDWMMSAQEKWGEKFAAKGLLLSPCVAQMYTTGEIAANLALEALPGLDTLDMLVLWKGFPTYASVQTIFTILKADWFFLENNQYVQWPTLTATECQVPGQHATALTLPWGGTSHPIWFKDDPRVSTVKVYGGVFAREVMDNVVNMTKMIDTDIKPLPFDEQEAALSKMAESVQGAMPPRENPRLNTSIDSVYASGPLGRVHALIHGNCNYKQTALLQAFCALNLLQQPPRRAGFASACQAFGHQALLGVMRQFGLVLKPIVTVHD